MKPVATSTELVRTLALAQLADSISTYYSCKISVLKDGMSNYFMSVLVFIGAI